MSMHRHCGFKGCVDNAVPGAYVEGLCFIGTNICTVRVEVCAAHFKMLAGEDVSGSNVGEHVA